MFDTLLDENLTKQQRYEEILLLLEGLVKDERDVLANLANTTSLLFYCLLDINWAGFYRACDDGLVLGPFQGKPACIRIPSGQGVCGKAFIEKKTVCVNDVDAFPGHIPCDSASKSEIVLPLILERNVVAVLDIDSPITSRFDSQDSEWLQKIVEFLQNTLDKSSDFWQLSK